MGIIKTRIGLNARTITEAAMTTASQKQKDPSSLLKSLCDNRLRCSCRSVNEHDLPTNMFVDSATYFGNLWSLLFTSNFQMVYLACSYSIRIYHTRKMTRWVICLYEKFFVQSSSSEQCKHKYFLNLSLGCKA